MRTWVLNVGTIERGIVKPYLPSATALSPLFLFWETWCLSNCCHGQPHHPVSSPRSLLTCDREYCGRLAGGSLPTLAGSSFPFVGSATPPEPGPVLDLANFPRFMFKREPVSGQFSDYLYRSDRWTGWSTHCPLLFLWTESRIHPARAGVAEIRLRRWCFGVVCASTTEAPYQACGQGGH